MPTNFSKLHFPKTRDLLFSVILFSLFLTSHNTISGAENAIQEAVQDNKGELNLTKLSWPINLDRLSKSNSANESFWVDIENERILVLKYRAQGRKFRGNIIILHAQGENADHPQVVNPLSHQLSQLGWQIFAPTLPIEDYRHSEKNSPVKTENNPTGNTTENDTSNSNNSPDKDLVAESSELDNPQKPKPFFSDAKSYQNFISQLIINLVDQIQPKSNNLIVIGIQNSSYWVLNSTKSTRQLSQVVLISPQLPPNTNKDLTAIFDGQYLPVHTFIENDHTSAAFVDAFEKNLWRSDNQRMKKGLITHNKISPEDVRIAKIITGWVESQQKTN